MVENKAIKLMRPNGIAMIEENIDREIKLRVIIMKLEILNGTSPRGNIVEEKMRLKGVISMKKENNFKSSIKHNSI